MSKKKKPHYDDDYNDYDDIDRQAAEERRKAEEIAADNATLLAFIDTFTPATMQVGAEMLDMGDLRLMFGAFASISGADPLTPWLQAIHREGYELRMNSFGTMALFVHRKRSPFRMRPVETDDAFEPADEQ